LADWLEAPAGRRAIAAETEVLAAWLRGFPPPHESLLVAPDACAPLLRVLAHRSGRAFAVYPPARGLSARRHPPASRLANWVRASAEHLPLRSGALDCVILAHTLETAVEPAAVLAECQRILAPQGRLVVLSFAPRCWQSWPLRRRRPLRWLPRMLLERELRRQELVVERRAGMWPGRRLQRLPGVAAWGGVTLLQARKEEPGMTPLGPVLRRTEPLPGRRAEAQPFRRSR
jgi:SAM-dependent methyltransferase